MVHLHRVLLLLVLVALVTSAPQQRQSAVPDKNALTAAFTDPAVVDEMIACFIDSTGDKCTPAQMQIKIRAREMFRNQGRCPSCTPEELANMEHSMELLQTQYPVRFFRLMTAMMGDGVRNIFSNFLQG